MLRPNLPKPSQTPLNQALNKTTKTSATSFSLWPTQCPSQRVSSSIPMSSNQASKPSLSSPTISSTSTPRTNSPSFSPNFLRNPT
ncbi:hypothetical protein ACFX15_013761 [Malus domestica]